MTTTEEAIAKLTGGGKKTTEEATAALLNSPGQAESNASWGQWLKNIDMALGQGVVKGVVSIPGLPGDIQQLIQSPKRETDLGNLMAALPQYPINSGDMLSAYEQVEQPFKKYTGVPAYAESAGEFFTPTPGGKAKVLRDVATAVGGGFGAQSFEDLAARLKLPPEWISLLGGILGVTAGAKGVKRPNAVKYAAEDAPSPELLKTNKDAAYAIAEGNKGLDRKAFAETVSDIAREIDEAGVEHVDEPGMGPKIQRLLDKDQLNFNNLDSLAQRAGAFASDPKASPKTKHYARIVLDNINKYYDKLEATNPGIKEQVARAKDLGRSNLLSRGVEEVRSPGYLSPTGEEIGEMNLVRSYMKSKDSSLTPLEKEAAEQAVGRTSRHSVARNVGRFLKSGPAQTMQAAAVLASPFVAGGQHAMEAIGSALGTAGLGYAAESWADVKTKKKLDELGAVLRSGKEGQAKAMAKADQLRSIANVSGVQGVLAAIRNEQAERSERNRNKKTKKKASLPEVELPVVNFWPTTE